MNNETLKILEMIENGKITAEQGAELIAAMDGSQNTTDAKRQRKPKRKMLRIRVNSVDPAKPDKANINLNIPLALAKKAVGLLSLIPRDAKRDLNDQGIDLDGIDIRALIEMFENGDVPADLVNLDSGDDTKGAKVHIYVD